MDNTSIAFARLQKKRGRERDKLQAKKRKHWKKKRCKKYDAKKSSRNVQEEEQPLSVKEACGGDKVEQKPDVDMLDVDNVDTVEPDVVMNMSPLSSVERRSIDPKLVVTEDTREEIIWHTSYTEGKCSNCHRTNLSSDTTYSFPTYVLYSHKIKKVNTSLRYVQSHKSVEDAHRLTLCDCCYRFLNADPSYDKDRFKWKNIWPSFMWDLLVGKDMSTGIPFCVSYEPEHLWKFIPSSCRRYWLESLKEFKVYKSCSIHEPKSYFVDRTLDLGEFRSNINRYDFKGFLRALDPSRLPGVRDEDCGVPSMLPNVLCPWGCAEFCHRSCVFEPAGLIQHHLRRVQLNLPPSAFEKLYLSESSRLDYLRGSDSSCDYVLMNKDWPILPSMILSRDGLNILVCRNHSKPSDQKRLHPHLPRKVLHPLASTRSSNLCHAVIRPRSLKSQISSKFNTAASVRTMVSGFSGSDTSCVSVNQSFLGGSRILLEEEVLSLKERPDIAHLAEAMVREQKILPDLKKDWEDNAPFLFGPREDDVRKARIGATFTPTRNALILQTHACDSSKIEAVILKKKNEKDPHDKVYVESNILCGRNWDPILGNLQVEDTENYGWPFKAIKPYSTDISFDNAVMLWCLTGMVTGCAELHYAIDRKSRPHHCHGWTGNLLTHISCEYMKHRDARRPPENPFVGSEALGHVKSDLTRLMPSGMSTYDGKSSDDPSLFFRLNEDYFRSIFPSDDFQNVSVHDSVDTIISKSHLVSDKDIFIVVSSTEPAGESHFFLPTSLDNSIGNVKFEARVVIGISPLDDDSRKFSGIRFSRHGSGYDRWWYQERRSKCKQLVKKYVGRGDINTFPVFPLSSCLFVTVYCKREDKLSSSYEFDLCRSLGMQCQVGCDCEELSSLIVTNKTGKARRSCNSDACTGKEHYCCPKKGCSTCICMKCFEDFAKKSEYVILSPIDNREDRSVESEDEFLDRAELDDYYSDDESVESVTANAKNSSFISCDAFDDASVSVGGLRRRDWAKNNSSCEGYDDDDEEEDDEVHESIHERMLESKRKITGAGCDLHESVNDMMQDFVTTTDLDPISCNSIDDYFQINSKSDQHVPRVNGAEMEVTIVGDTGTIAPSCVVFNQLGNNCTRYSKRINGTQTQQHFVQKLVSSIRGISFPILYLPALLFPGIFWAAATHDKYAVLGSPIISSERRDLHPNGFSSPLQNARNSLTHASSSSSNCHNYAAFHYDRLANRVGSNHHSAQIARHGFRVSNPTSDGSAVGSGNGIEIGSGNDSTLQESVDSSQMAVNLAAASRTIQFDLFLTLTPNQAKHPGLRHLYEWKESEDWSSMIPDWEHFSPEERSEFANSFEMAYMSTVSRCWMEVRKLLLEFIMTSSSTILGKVLPAFFRDEYQDDSGNLSHIHGLFGLLREDMDNSEFTEFVCSLQRSAVCDLITGDEIPSYIEQGLLKDVDDFKEFTDTAACVLNHSCASRRCLVRQGDSGTSNDYRCKKPHPVDDSIDPMENEWIPFNYEWSDSCLDVLKQCHLYEEPSDEFPRGRFLNDVLDPKRHMGKVTASTQENLSPVIPQFFALTRSQQNAQILTGTHAISRYVAKYVVKMDAGNRCVIWADSHTGAVLRAERQFLHNTKITRSEKFENSAHQKSRARNQPVGRNIAFTEMQQQILGYNDVTHNLTFEVIESKPTELRKTTRIKDFSGKLLSDDDVTMPLGSVWSIREKLKLSRKMSKNQELTLRGSNASYDKVSIFGLRPVELVQLFPRVGEYFRWFKIEDKILSDSEIQEGLSEDVLKCLWIDGLGRRVKLRKAALPYAEKWMKSIPRYKLSVHSSHLRDYLLKVMKDGKECPEFVTTEEDKLLPIPVFSRVSPEQPSAFLLHIMIMLGEFETELEFRQQKSIKLCLSKCNLIPSDHLDDRSYVQKYSNDLLKRIIEEVFSVQPITLRRLEIYIVRCKRLLDSVLLDDAIPIIDLPPTILTELLNERRKDLDDEWDIRRANLLDVIYKGLPDGINVPSKEDIMSCNKTKHLEWDPLTEIPKYELQTDESYKEQQASVSLAVKAVDNYSKQFGNVTQTRGIISEGAPGSGKSFVLLVQGLLAMTRGLRVLSSALMAKRSMAVGGGYHLHKLFCLECNQKGNPRRLAELAIDKLHRKSNLKMLHLLMTMDVLLLDEVGTLSAQELSQLDCILRNIRHSNTPFGGVLIFSSMDHQQIGTIKGMPLLLSSHIMTDFVLIRLKHSVRCHGDAALQRIQQITRMSPLELQSSQDLHDEFTELMSSKVQFVSSMKDPKLGPEVLRMYSRRAECASAAEDYVDSSIQNLTLQGKSYKLCEASDLTRPLQSRRDLQTTNDPAIKKMLDKKRREPRRLLFHHGALFEATVNGKGYSQSQIVIMIEQPTHEDIDSWAPLPMMAAPATFSPNDFHVGRTPTKEELINEGWTEVTIHVTQERNPLNKYGSECYRKQYTIKHIGSSTINKTQGQTIIGPVAIEVTPKCSPWEKEQVVVMLSRTPLASMIYIAGDKDFAIEKIWSVLCKRTQWTDYVESILKNWAIDGDGVESQKVDENRVLDLHRAFPWKLCNVTLPTDNDSGFVYMLISVVNHDRTYVGQTKNISIRLNQHNSGFGAKGTAPAEYLPYAPCCFITNMSNLDKHGREQIEKKWKKLNKLSEQRGEGFLENRIENGRTVMEEYNSRASREDWLKFVVCVTRDKSHNK